LNRVASLQTNSHLQLCILQPHITSHHHVILHPHPRQHRHPLTSPIHARPGPKHPLRPSPRLHPRHRKQPPRLVRRPTPAARLPTKLHVRPLRLRQLGAITACTDSRDHRARTLAPAHPSRHLEPARPRGPLVGSSRCKAPQRASRASSSSTRTTSRRCRSSIPTTPTCAR
jgi:hypothetical protein